jgi:hypothetical protein
MSLSSDPQGLPQWQVDDSTIQDLQRSELPLFIPHSVRVCVFPQCTVTLIDGNCQCIFEGSSRVPTSSASRGPMVMNDMNLGMVDGP